MPAGRAGASSPFDAPDRQDGDRQRAECHRGGHADQPPRAERVQQRAGARRRRHDPGDHHQPEHGCRRRTAARIDACRHEDQHRGAGRPDAQPDQQEPHGRQHDPGEQGATHQRCPGRRDDPAGRQRRHPPDDPGRAAAAAVGPVAELRTQHLDGIMQRDQHARQEGRERPLHHHHAVQRRDRQHRDGAECRLHQPKPGDIEPAESPAHAGTSARTAKAATIMPMT